MKRKRHLKHDRNYSWVISLAILIIGFSFWVTNMVSVVMNKCLDMKAFWLHGYTPLYWCFAWAVGLLSMWNILSCVSVFSTDIHNRYVNIAIHVVNLIALGTLGWVLISLWNHIQLDAIYRLPTKWIRTYPGVIYPNPCWNAS